MLNPSLLQMQLKSRINKIRRDPQLQLKFALSCFGISVGLFLLYALVSALGSGAPPVDSSILLFDSGTRTFYVGAPENGRLPAAPSGQPAVHAVVFGNDQHPLPVAGTTESELAVRGQFIGYFERLESGKAEVCAADGKWEWKARESTEGLKITEHVTLPPTDKKPGARPVTPATPLRPLAPSVF